MRGDSHSASAVLVMAGFLMVAGHSSLHQQNVFAVYADYASSFFSTGSGAVIY
jgi:hypothetical protein